MEEMTPPSPSRPEAGAPPAPPLYVDLDGTFAESDVLWEGLSEIARTRPWRLLAVAAALFRDGRPGLKRQVAAEAPKAIAALPVNRQVLEFVVEERVRRPVILATASHEDAARPFAEGVGLFAGVLASSGATNLKSRVKLERIQSDATARTGSPAFDYIGDSVADRPIWAQANAAFVVARDDDSALRVSGGVAVVGRFDSKVGDWRDAVRAMRPHQWVKNALVFLPVILAHDFLNPALVALSLAAFVAMSLCASATYIWNDILDLPSDRSHRTKKNRPIAAGRLPIARAVALSGAALAASLVVALAAGGPLLVAGLVGYVVLTLSYSLFIKRKLLIDAVLLALLYGYRIILGVIVTGIPISDWLIAFSTFFFFGLALIKRYVEIDAVVDQSTGPIRGRGYRGGDREVILALGVSASQIAVIVLGLYVSSPGVRELYRIPSFLWGVAVILIYWSGRAWVLAHRRELNEDPIVFALKDRVSRISLAACAALVLLAQPI